MNAEALRLDFLELGENETHCDFILRVLKVNGSITRNFLLQHFITRGAARISDLKKMGYNIKGENYKVNGGLDYRYILKGM
jgi:hypothetical protein